MMMPLGTYTNAMRTGGLVLRTAAIAGTIASRNGSATVVPMPLRNARLGKAFLVIIIVEPLPSARPSHHGHHGSREYFRSRRPGPFETGRYAQFRKSKTANGSRTPLHCG